MQRFAPLLQRLIFVAFNLLFFLTPFVFTWMNQELFEFSKMIFVYLMSVIIVVLWGWRMLAEGRLIWRASPLDWALWVFVFSQVLATIFSMHPRTSWFGYYTRFNGGLWSTLTFVGLYHAILANLNRTQVKTILSSLLLAVLLVSLWAIPEKFGYSTSCLLITKHFDTNCWTENNNPSDRVFASFGQPNWLAAFLITLLPLALQQLWSQKKLRSKAYLGLVVLTASAAVWLTGSRSGWLGLAGGLTSYFLIRYLANKKIPWHYLLVGIGLTGAVAGIFAWHWTKAVAIPTQEGGTPSEEIRKIVWQGAWRIWQRYPLLGAGVETFAYSYYLDRPVAHNLVSEWDFLYNKAHNELLNLLANSGAIGLFTYLWMLGAVGWYLLQQRGSSSIAAALGAGLVAMTISNFFGFSTVNTNLLLFGFMAMIVVLADKPISPKNTVVKKIDQNKLNRNTEYFLAAILLVLGLASLRQITQIWQADYLFTRGQASLQSRNYQQGLSLIQEAIVLSPHEALFYDELANHYSQISLDLANSDQTTASAEFARAAIASNQQALTLNPHHLNFYKSQARIFISLGQLDPKLYQQAADTLRQAIILAPTDAKLYYNLSLVLEILGQTDAARQTMEQAVQLKTNYLQARNELARMYFLAGDYEAAAQQYRYNLEHIAPADELVQEKLRIVEASMSGATE